MRSVAAQGQTAERPLTTSSITPRALTWKGSNSPAHSAAAARRGLHRRGILGRWLPWPGNRNAKLMSPPGWA